MFEVIVQIPSLTSMDQSSNEPKGESVSLSIWCQSSDMGGFAQVMADTIAGKCTAACQRAYVVSSVGEPPWTIQVRRDS